MPKCLSVWLSVCLFLCLYLYDSRSLFTFLFLFSASFCLCLSLFARPLHRCTQGGVRGVRGDETAPPRQIFKKLVNKNAIKPKIGGPPRQFFPKPLTPPLGILAKTSRTPSPGFSTRVHIWSPLFFCIYLIFNLSVCQHICLPVCLFVFLFMLSYHGSRMSSRSSSSSSSSSKSSRKCSSVWFVFRS